jgi:hypothetical protein
MKGGVFANHFKHASAKKSTYRKEIRRSERHGGHRGGDHHQRCDHHLYRFCRLYKAVSGLIRIQYSAYIQHEMSLFTSIRS